MSASLQSGTKADRVRALNDALRTTFQGGRVMMTAGVAHLPERDRQAVLQAVQRFDAFSADNDPHGEHDFGSVTHGGQTYFWKVDCYDRTLTSGSPDPGDPSVTVRVLTVMRADEY